MDVETDYHVLSIAFKSFTFPLKHQEWVRKWLVDLEKAGIIQRCISSYASLI